MIEMKRITSLKQHIKVSIKNEVDAGISMLDGSRDERTPSLLKQMELWERLNADGM